MAAVMIQGCGSDVGKTLLVAGLCRLFTNRGLIVRPFKPQNMSNNAAVTACGGEIGRSTALQALACRAPPTVHMNPVLLKPQSDRGAQLIVRGQRVGTLDASAHGRSKSGLLDIALASFRTLQSEAQLVIVEGAGSPAETNLRTHDIANMGFAGAADIPVLLVGDIDRGHVIAALVGAHAVLSAADRHRIRGFIINKFRGDERLFDAGLATIAARTSWPNFGVVPWLSAAARLPAEDAVQIDNIALANATHERIKIVVPRWPHIANFDDLDPLRLEPGIDLQFIPPGQPLPLDAALILLPGSKATITDLQHLRTQGWDGDIHAHVRRGGRVLGICAGYQMLGRVVRDPAGIEGRCSATAGLGLLNVDTTITSHKTLRAICGVENSTSAKISGYEMHMGATLGAGTSRPMIHFDDSGTDGAVSNNGRIAGCHIHGLFANNEFRAALIAMLGGKSAVGNYDAVVDAALNEVADTLEKHLAVENILAMAGG